jgi:maltose alpha-D-glucosyltransferase/alpha-amylase
MAFHFPVMPRIFMALARADCSPIVEILASTPTIPDNCQWCTFLRNHDELTLEMVTPDERQFMWETYAPVPRMRLNLGIRRRLAPLLDGDRRKIELAHSILFSLPGSPILYYGDEIGMGDNIALDDRDGVRTPMQWDDGPHAGFTSPEVPASRLYSPLIDDAAFGYRSANVAGQQADPTSLWQTLRHMIATRKAHPVFSRGESVLLSLQGGSGLVVLRFSREGIMVAVHNLTPEPQELWLDLAEWIGARVREVLSESVDYPPASAAFPVELGPYGYAWLALERR